MRDLSLVGGTRSLYAAWFRQNKKTSKNKRHWFTESITQEASTPHWLARHVQRQNGALKDAHILVPKYCQYVTLHGKHDFAVTIKNLRWADYHEVSS